MANAAANAAMATEIFSVQILFYKINPGLVTSGVLLFASQLLGYGIGGLMRRELRNILYGDVSLNVFFAKRLLYIHQKCYILTSSP